MTFTCWTGLLVTSADVMLTERGADAPRSRTLNRCRSPTADGNSPAFMAAAAAPFTTSVPSTSSIRAPRARPAVAAGEPGSM